MITARIEENGRYVGFVMIFPAEGDSEGWGRYTYEYHRPHAADGELGKTTERAVTGEVDHFAPAGVSDLLKEVFEDIDTQG